MRILTVSDKVEPVLYGPYIRERVGQVDLILACGDLPYYYLEYIVSLLDVPLFFVHGNHDKPIQRQTDPIVREERHESALHWATDLHQQSVAHKGLLLAGLEGCRRYSPDRPYQYSETEVRRQVLALSGRLLLNKARFGRFADIIITHAPPRRIHDGEDLPHQGFESYLWLIQRFRPLLFIHGHQHIYNRNIAMETALGKTRILNTYGYRVIELAQDAGDAWQLVSSSR